jgi:hypothetical protein
MSLAQARLASSTGQISLALMALTITPSRTVRCRATVWAGTFPCPATRSAVVRPGVMVVGLIIARGHHHFGSWLLRNVKKPKRFQEGFNSAVRYFHAVRVHRPRW